MRSARLDVLFSTTDPNTLDERGRKLLDDTVHQMVAERLVLSIAERPGAVDIVVMPQLWHGVSVGKRECWLHVLALFADLHHPPRNGHPNTVVVQEPCGKVVGTRPQNWNLQVLA